MTTTVIEVDSAALEGLADKVSSFGSAVNGLFRDVVNKVTTGFEQRVRDQMSDINLSQDYISGRMTTVLAEDVTNPEATITALGGRAGNVILGHFQPVVTYVPAATGQKAKGDAKRGVPAGFRANGVTVEVRKGARKPIQAPGAFTMTLKRGTEAGDTVGVFLRAPGSKVLRHLYSVAPYQVLRREIAQGADALGIELTEAAINAIVDQYGRTFQ